MSSVPFNLAMLTASPSPSPEPEERPQDKGNTSVDDATLNDASPKELEETVANWIRWSWAIILTSMRVSVKTCPPPKPELLEDQESWLRTWERTMGDMSSLFERARINGVHLLIGDSEAVDLVSGKAAVKTLTKAIKAWKEKAEESAVTARPTRTEKEKESKPATSAEMGKEKAVETDKVAEKDKAVVKEVTDMGRPRLGSRITATSVTYPEEPCARCAVTGARCVLSDASLRCHGCTKAKKACSFVAEKAKERALAAPKTKAVALATAKAKTPIPVPAPKAKTPVPAVAPTAGSVTDTAPVVGDSDVEIIGESTADEDTAIIGKTIIVQRPKCPLAARPAPAPKRPRLDLEAQLEESRIEAAQLRIRNAELEAEVAKWRGTVVDLRQHSRVQEVEVLSMSNQIYSMGRDWGAWEKEIAEMLEKK
ncbi:hypothetical protein EV424DRAFT_1532427 [Suillus variegatus]|nr:hypothetical protein EV424DRAFT_1532427 [Suillus variegatus]